MFNPLNLNAAFGLAKIQQKYLTSAMKVGKSVAEKFVSPYGGSSYSEPMVSSNKCAWYSTSSQLIYSSQMEENLRKGLCYHGDEK